MRLHDYTPPVAAAAMYSVPTPEELTDATARVIERLQADETVGPLASAYQAVLEAAGRRMANSFTRQAVALTADSQFVPPDEDEVVNPERLAEEIADLAREVRRNAARVVVAELDDEGISYDVDTVFTDELLDRIASNAAFNIEAELRDTYRFTLEVAADQGWSVADTAGALQNKVSDLAPHTARAIARTELNGLANGGSVHVASKTVGRDQQLYKNWLATNDERTRETHLEANGQSRLVNEHFVVGGASLNYPGEPFGPPEEVINCRCTVTYSSTPEGTVVVDPNAPTEPAPEVDPLARIKPSQHQIDVASEPWNLGVANDLAKQHNITVEEYKRRLEVKLADELGAPDVGVRIRTPADVALEVARDGKFLNQFESGTSGGAYAPEARKTAEEAMFGIDYLDDAQARPIYGYLSGVTREWGSVNGYGDVVWVLKNEVRERATWTATDSLASRIAPSPVTRPSVLSVDTYAGPPAGLTHLQAPLREWDTVYFEAQVHGGVTLNDVERVEMYYHLQGPRAGEGVDLTRVPDWVARDADALRQALEGTGIQVEVKPYPGELTGSGDQLAGDIGLGHDGLEVDVAGGLHPVTTSDDAQHGQLVVDDAGTLVEHPAHGRAEPVLAPTGEHQERVPATLGDHLHTPDHNGSVGGSQPSGPLPLHPPNQEAPMSTTETQQLATGADGEVEMLTPIAWDAVLCVEGETTEDGRLLERGSISWRDLPLTLMGMLKTGGWGHEGAEVSGRIDSISRVMDELPASGELTSDFGINKLAPLIADRTVRGVSIDLAVLDWEYRDRDTGAVLSEEDLFDYWIEGRETDIVFAVLEGTIVGATVCPMPAIANAEIALAASAGLDQHARALIAAAIDGRNIGPDDVRIIKVFTPFDRQRTPLIAAGPLVELAAPPRSHFEVSEFPGKTPFTVTEPDETGWRRAFGHLATWDTCHVGIPGVCTTAPRSSTTPAYALFHQGQYETDDGLIDVGKMMLGTGHADLGASRMEATRHYDKPDMVGAYVRATDGEHGIWVSGVVRPELTAAGIRELRANPPSGDWRSYNGRLELIAACAVAVPGFPVVADAKANITASGGEVAISALIASAGLIVPTSEVKAALVAAGCDCDELATDDEYVDDLAELGED